MVLDHESLAPAFSCVWMLCAFPSMFYSPGGEGFPVFLPTGFFQVQISMYLFTIVFWHRMEP